MSIWKEITNPTSFAGQYDTEVEFVAPAHNPLRHNGSKEPTIKKESVIGPGLVIEGKIDGEGDLRIGGCVKGDVSVKGSLTLDPGACIVGAVNADEVILGGQVEGNVSASGHVKLLETGQLLGDLKAKFLTAALGSRLRGKVEFGWNEPEAKERRKSADSDGTQPAANANPQ
jgi:cytoskeletal protein CcmA (bactofilin family)